MLFDLDGTLIATTRLYLECYRRALAPFCGRELSDDELLALKPRSEVRLLRAQVGDARLAACLDTFYGHYRELHASHFEGVCAGVPTLLDALRSAGRRLGIITGKSRRAWEITSERAPLGAFDVLVFDDDVAAPKPDPEGIRRALAQLGLRPEQSIYIGDTIGDVRAALAAGAAAGAVLWPKAERERDGFRGKAAAEGALVFDTPAAVADTIITSGADP